MNSEIKAIAVASRDLPIVKCMTMRGPGFALPVVYTLENGNQVTGHLTDTKKKSLLSQLAKKNAAAQGGFVSVRLDDAGALDIVIQTGGFNFGSPLVQGVAE